MYLLLGHSSVKQQTVTTSTCNHACQSSHSVLNTVVLSQCNCKHAVWSRKLFSLFLNDAVERKEFQVGRQPISSTGSTDRESPVTNLATRSSYVIGGSRSDSIKMTWVTVTWLTLHAVLCYSRLCFDFVVALTWRDMTWLQEMVLFQKGHDTVERIAQPGLHRTEKITRLSLARSELNTLN